MELHQENVSAKWTVPQCPFTIEYSPRVLDDIRLAVTDAFFSLPRGGAEIGGLLLGRQEKGRIAILDSLPIECEHAFGPSFVLSDRDTGKLAELVAAAGRNPQLTPLGWWHSHTRSEIFLSDADQKIHTRFFPEPWQVALVLKPHTFQPTRAGFFFREPDGAFHAEASYQEIVLDPMPMRPAGEPEVPRVSPSAPPASGDAGGRVINIASVALPDLPAVEPEPEPEPLPEVAPPSFLSVGGEPSPPRRWIGWVAAAFGVTLAVVGYSTRDGWLPLMQARLQPTPIEAISLNTLDDHGQLQIRWNGAAPPVRSARAGSLLILDGASTVNVPLDAAHVQSGAYTFLRKSDRVDVTLALAEAGGKEVRVATLFSGESPLPPKEAAPEAIIPAAGGDDAKGREERDALRAQNGGLKLELARQIERNKLLEKGLEELRKVIDRDQQRKRLEAQDPGK